MNMIWVIATTKYSIWNNFRWDEIGNEQIGQLVRSLVYVDDPNWQNFLIRVESDLMKK